MHKLVFMGLITAATVLALVPVALGRGNPSVELPGERLVPLLSEAFDRAAAETGFQWQELRELVAPSQALEHSEPAREPSSAEKKTKLVEQYVAGLLAGSEHPDTP